MLKIFPMKTKSKRRRRYSMMELALLCGSHYDTLARSRRQGYCSRRLATLLEQVTGIDRDRWIVSGRGPSPWDEVIRRRGE